MVKFAHHPTQGILTLVVPAGKYDCIKVYGRDTIDLNSFQRTARPYYPIWRWFVAPVKVLGSESGLSVIVIIVLFFAGFAEVRTVINKRLSRLKEMEKGEEVVSSWIMDGRR